MIKKVRYFSVELEVVFLPPWFSFSQGGEGWSSKGGSGDVKLTVVSITVEVKTVTMDDFTNWENA